MIQDVQNIPVQEAEQDLKENGNMLKAIRAVRIIITNHFNLKLMV